MGSDLSAGLRAEIAAPSPSAPARPRAAQWTKLAAGAERLLRAGGCRDYLRAFWVWAAVASLFFGLLVAHGPCLQLFYGHDDLGFLAAAWKVRGGIWPHADYHSALGALSPWIHAAGLWLLGPTATVIPFCNALVALGLGWLAWAVASRRLPAVLAGVFAFTQTVVAMTPHLLRFEWYAATYDGYYNRQGYALLTTLLLLLFLPPVDAEDGRTRRRDERLAGAILGVLFFLKVSYFMAGVGLCGTACLLGRRFLKPIPWHAAAAFAVTFLLCLPLIRFDLAGMLADLRMAAGARTGTPAAEFSVGRYLSWLPDAWLEVILLATAQALLQPPLLRRRREGAGNPPVPTWAEYGAVMGASMFLCMTNSPGGSHSETPLLTSWIFVLLGSFLRAAPVATEVNPFRHPPERLSLPFLGAVACILWAYTFGNGFRCLCWVASPWPTPWQQAALAENPRFDSPSLATLPIADSGGEPMLLPYAGKVNDGVRLLRALGGSHRVEALDFANPFPFAMQWPATRGGMWCWHDGYSFSIFSHPTAEEAFGDADVLMIPKYAGETASFRAMRQPYAPYIKSHFGLAAESGQWFLLRRR